MARFQFSLRDMFWMLLASAIISAICLITKLRFEAAHTDKELEKHFWDPITGDYFQSSPK